MTEWKKAMDLVGCRRRDCHIYSDIVESAGNKQSGIRYRGKVRCETCDKSWEYARVEGAAAALLQRYRRECAREEGSAAALSVAPWPARTG